MERKCNHCKTIFKFKNSDLNKKLKFKKGETKTVENRKREKIKHKNWFDKLTNTINYDYVVVTTFIDLECKKNLYDLSIKCPVCANSNNVITHHEPWYFNENLSAMLNPFGEPRLINGDGWKIVGEE